MFSFHCELATVAAVDLVSHNDFLGASPPVFMTPHVAPIQKVGHGQHRDTKSTHKWLSTDHWEEQEGGSGGE